MPVGTAVAGSRQASLRSGHRGSRSSLWSTSHEHGPLALGPDYTNGTLVGASRDQLAGWGYDPADVPNIDDRIEACLPLVGSAQFECWATLDQYVMENVVPLVPYVFEKYPSVLSPRVVSYAFDQLWAGPAWDRIAVGG
jgi:hypothetical protein